MRHWWSQGCYDTFSQQLHCFVYVVFAVKEKTVTFISSATQPANQNPTRWRILNSKLCRLFGVICHTSTSCSFSKTAWHPVHTPRCTCPIENIMFIMTMKTIFLIVTVLMCVCVCVLLGSQWNCWTYFRNLIIYWFQNIFISMEASFCLK